MFMIQSPEVVLQNALCARHSALAVLYKPRSQSTKSQWPKWQAQPPRRMQRCAEHPKRGTTWQGPWRCSLARHQCPGSTSPEGEGRDSFLIKNLGKGRERRERVWEGEWGKRGGGRGKRGGEKYHCCCLRTCIRNHLGPSWKWDSWLVLS